MGILKLFLLVVAAQLAVGITIPLLFPELLAGTRTLLREDGLVESTSAFAFLAAGIVACWYLLRGAHRRWLLWLCVLAGFLCFLHELSFGERFFSASMPTLGGVKIDGAHDFFTVAARALRRAGAGVAIPLLAVGGTIAVAVAWKLRARLLDLARSLATDPPRAAFALVVGMLAVAMFLDNLHYFGFHPGAWPHGTYFVGVTEELLEMNAGLCLGLVAVLARAEEAPATARARSAPAEDLARID